MTTITRSDVLAWIANEATMDDLDRIVAQLNARKTALRNQARNEALAELQVGTKVRLKNISPKYMVGATAVVTGFNKTTVDVELDEGIDPRGLRRFGRTPRVPLDCVEVIE